MWVQSGCGLWLCLPDVWRVHLWQVVQGFGACPRFRGVFRAFVPAFWLLSCFALVGLLANMPLFRILRGFCGVLWGLCCLRALRGLWGFCVREWLGGLKACGVFAFLFILLHLCLLLFCPFVLSFVLSTPAVLGLSFLSLCGLFLGSLFPFPFRTIRKKERAQSVLRPLFVGRGCLDACIVIKEFRCRCFGFF